MKWLICCLFRKIFKDDFRVVNIFEEIEKDKKAAKQIEKHKLVAKKVGKGIYSIANVRQQVDRSYFAPRILRSSVKPAVKKKRRS